MWVFICMETQIWDFREDMEVMEIMEGTVTMVAIMERNKQGSPVNMLKSQ